MTNKNIIDIDELETAIFINDFQKVNELLKIKSKEQLIVNTINIKDDLGDSILHNVIWELKGKELETIVKLLLENGTNINSVDSEGRTPLMIATIKGYINIVKILINSGADVNIKDKAGNIALHSTTDALCLKRRATKIIMELLLNNGVDVNEKNNDGNTPLLFLAVSAKYFCLEDKEILPIINLLLSKGADIDIKNKYGYSPLSYAEKNCSVNVINLLKNKQTCKK